MANGLAITEPPAGNTDIDISDSANGEILAVGDGSQLVTLKNSSRSLPLGNPVELAWRRFADQVILVADKPTAQVGPAGQSKR